MFRVSNKVFALGLISLGLWVNSCTNKKEEPSASVTKPVLNTNILIGAGPVSGGTGDWTLTFKARKKSGGEAVTCSDSAGKMWPKTTPVKAGVVGITADSCGDLKLEGLLLLEITASTTSALTSENWAALLRTNSICKKEGSTTTCSGVLNLVQPYVTSKVLTLQKAINYGFGAFAQANPNQTALTPGIVLNIPPELAQGLAQSISIAASKGDQTKLTELITATQKLNPLDPSTGQASKATQALTTVLNDLVVASQAASSDVNALAAAQDKFTRAITTQQDPSSGNSTTISLTPTVEAIKEIAATVNSVKDCAADPSGCTFIVSSTLPSKQAMVMNTCTEVPVSVTDGIDPAATNISIKSESSDSNRKLSFYKISGCSDEASKIDLGTPILISDLSPLKDSKLLNFKFYLKDELISGQNPNQSNNIKLNINITSDKLKTSMVIPADISFVSSSTDTNQMVTKIVPENLDTLKTYSGACVEKLFLAQNKDGATITNVLDKITLKSVPAGVNVYKTNDAGVCTCLPDALLQNDVAVSKNDSGKYALCIQASAQSGAVSVVLQDTSASPVIVSTEDKTLFTDFSVIADAVLIDGSKDLKTLFSSSAHQVHLPLQLGDAQLPEFSAVSMGKMTLTSNDPNLKFATSVDSSSWSNSLDVEMTNSSVLSGSLTFYVKYDGPISGDSVTPNLSYKFTNKLNATGLVTNLALANLKFVQPSIKIVVNPAPETNIGKIWFYDDCVPFSFVEQGLTINEITKLSLVSKQKEVSTNVVVYNGTSCGGGALTETSVIDKNNKYSFKVNVPSKNESLLDDSNSASEVVINVEAKIDGLGDQKKNYIQNTYVNPKITANSLNWEINKYINDDKIEDIFNIIAGENCESIRTIGLFDENNRDLLFSSDSVFNDLALQLTNSDSNLVFYSDDHCETKIEPENFKNLKLKAKKAYFGNSPYFTYGFSDFQVSYKKAFNPLIKENAKINISFKQLLNKSGGKFAEISHTVRANANPFYFTHDDGAYAETVYLQPKKGFNYYTLTDYRQFVDVSRATDSNHGLVPNYCYGPIYIKYFENDYVEGKARPYYIKIKFSENIQVYAVRKDPTYDGCNQMVSQGSGVSDPKYVYTDDESKPHFISVPLYVRFDGTSKEKGSNEGQEAVIWFSDLSGDFNQKIKIKITNPTIKLVDIKNNSITTKTTIAKTECPTFFGNIYDSVGNIVTADYRAINMSGLAIVPSLNEACKDITFADMVLKPDEKSPAVKPTNKNINCLDPNTHFTNVYNYFYIEDLRTAAFAVKPPQTTPSSDCEVTFSIEQTAFPFSKFEGQNPGEPLKWKFKIK